ncbi:MAG: glycoside hydrolase family 65 [Lachnospiraceae bacterium]|nr:glycoside hydrolase family 65 [Lachnospiraceae bacterium]
MINREALVKKYNPFQQGKNTHSPLTVGNGGFAFTADITGLQTLFEEYEKDCPVLTMAAWGWHTSPDEDGKFYSLDDFKYEMTEYYFEKRIVRYPVTENERNKKLYKYLRENPHKFNLARLSLCKDGIPVRESEITDVHQELDMYTGVLKSSYKVCGENVTVTTIVGNTDTLGVKVESKLLKEGLSVLLEFPYASHCKSGSDFSAQERHATRLLDERTIERKLDNDTYFCMINGNLSLKRTGMHSFLLEDSGLTFTLSFAKERDSLAASTFKQVREESEFRLYSFWNKGAMVDVTASEDKRAEELERRIITSMYLIAVQDVSYYPPAETGLTCNSWYGKFHLEMHPIHQAFLALYGRGSLLEKSLKWYTDNLSKAVENAERNGFKGARWPKMTGPDAEDSPSPIAPLLVWQQPHIIYMIWLLYLSRYGEARVEVPSESEEEFLRRYEEVIEKTGEFMEDFLVYDEKSDTYNLCPPLYSVQEKGDPLKMKNPPFELAYFSFGLKTAAELLNKLGIDKSEWIRISEKIKKPYISEGKLQAYEGFDETYEKLNIDHPSMVFAPGFIGEEADEEVLNNSLKAIEENWDFSSLWGWDFAFLAMTYARLGRMEEAFDILLKDTAKNTYVESGNNAQAERSDLPLYLPGNASLLLAMTALKSCKGWYVQTEGIMPYVF